MASLEFSDEENELDHGANRNDRDSDDDGGFRSDEAEEDRTDQNPENGGESTARRIDPSTSKKRVVRNPQPKLNAERIQGPKGVQTIEKYFEGFKFRGKGHEKSDLDKVMKRLEHWAHRLFPKYQFDDFLEKMETLGTKKNVQVFLKKYRLGMETPHVDTIDPDDEAANETSEQPAPEEAPADEFDKLIAEQIEKQRRVTDQEGITPDTVPAPGGNVLGTAKHSEMSDEIKARIEANRKLAIERKNARLRKIEEETRKRKLEDSQEESQVCQSSNAEVTTSAPYPEQPREDDLKKISSAIEDSAIEVLSSAAKERIATIHQPFEGPDSDSEKSRDRSTMDADSEKLSDLMEIPDKGHIACASKSNETFDNNYTSQNRLEDIEDVLDEMEYTDAAKTYRTPNKKSKDDLLSKEELQKEINNAIEEIISRNAQKNN